MGHVLLFKAMALFAALVLVVPLVFFLLVGLIGHRFALTIQKDSWLATTRIRMIRTLFRRYVI